MDGKMNYENIINDIHDGKYKVKSVIFAEPGVKRILDDYISNIPEEIDAVVERARNQGYTFSELVSLVAQSSVKKGLNLR